MKEKKLKIFKNIFSKYQKYGYFEFYTALEGRAEKWINYVCQNEGLEF